MATYKKRGYKPKNKEERQDAVEEQSTTAEVFNTLDEKASRAEMFVASNQKYIFIVVAVIAVGVLGYLGYREFVAKPAAEVAMNDLFPTQKYFDQAVNTTVNKDSLYTLVLNGGEGKFGALDIIEEHGGTPAADLANYMAGFAYLNLNDYQNAITHLQNFSSDDEMLVPLAKGGIGDAFSELNQLEDALEYYKEALSLRKNEYTTPLFMHKAGTIALQLENFDAALKQFEGIKENYPNSTQAANIDALIGFAKSKTN